jgi:hypothetical protein
MTKELLNRLRKNRELRVTFGKFIFIARRPTDVEVLELQRKNDAFTSIAQNYVIGWEGVIEDDIIGGGGTDVVPFSAELWHEWSSDHPDFWQPITDAVLAAYKSHSEGLAQDAKN